MPHCPCLQPLATISMKPYQLTRILLIFWVYLFLLIGNISYGQSKLHKENGYYKFDPYLKEKINKLYEKSSGFNSTKPCFAEINFNTDGNQSGLDNCILTTLLKGDTIIISGMSSYGNVPVPFQIILIKNTYKARIFTDPKIDPRLWLKDSINPLILFHCKTSQLTLIRKPEFKVGEVIEGFMEFTAEETEMEYKVYFSNQPLKKFKEMNDNFERVYSSKDFFWVKLKVPQDTNLTNSDYKIYKVEKDSLFIVNSDFIKGIGRHDSIISKYPIGKEQLQKLKDVIANTGNLINESNRCIPTNKGLPRFSLFFNDPSTNKNSGGQLSNVYRKNYFDIIEILNDINLEGDIIKYDKVKLIEAEIECFNIKR